MMRVNVIRAIMTWAGGKMRDRVTMEADVI